MCCQDCDKGEAAIFIRLIYNELRWYLNIVSEDLTRLIGGFVIKKRPIFHFGQFVFSVLIVMGGLAGCSATDVEDTRGGSTASVSSVTANVGTNAGPVNEIILDDTLDFSSHLANNLETYIADNVGDRDSTTNFLAQGEPLAAADSNNENDVDTDIEITESAETCSGGGTKQLAGVLNLQVFFNSDQGSLSGQYNIIYTNCVQTVSLATSNGTCSVEVLLTGAIVNDISIDFTELSEFDPDIFETRNQVTTSSPLTFANGTGATQQVTYDFDLYINSRLSSPDIDGDLTFDGDSYDVVAVSDFIGTSTTSVICP